MIRPFCHSTPQIHPSAFIDASAVVTGKVWIGEGASVWPCVSIRGDLMEIHIGARSNIQDGSVIHTTHQSDFSPQGYGVTMGCDVTVGHNVTLHGCTLEDEILIGMGSIILDGVYIPSQVLIGAGSLVAPGKILESGYLYLGNPAKKVRVLTDAERRFFKYSAQHYVTLATRHGIL